MFGSYDVVDTNGHVHHEHAAGGLVTYLILREILSTPPQPREPREPKPRRDWGGRFERMMRASMVER